MTEKDTLFAPLEVEELIREAEAQQKKGKKPSNGPPPIKKKPWQQLMDDRLYCGH